MKEKEKEIIKKYILDNYNLKVFLFKTDRFKRNGFYDLRVKSVKNENIVYEMHIAKNKKNNYFLYLNGNDEYGKESLEKAKKRFPHLLRNKLTKDIYNLVEDINSYLQIFLLKKFSIGIADPIKLFLYSYSIANFNFDDGTIESIDKIIFSLFDEINKEIFNFSIEKNEINILKMSSKENYIFNNLEELKEIIVNISNSILNKSIMSDIHNDISLKMIEKNIYFNLNHNEIDSIKKIPDTIDSNFKILEMLIY